MILVKAQFFLLLACFSLVAFVECKKRSGGKGDDKENVKEAVKERDTSLPEEKKVVNPGFWANVGHSLLKSIHVTGDKVKEVWHKHVKNFKKTSDKGRKISVGSEYGENIIIGDKALPKQIGKGSKAYCVEVYSKRGYKAIREAETTITNYEKEDISEDFEQKSNRIWKCLDRTTAATFFIVEREYVGLKEVHMARVFHNIKAWRVQLRSWNNVHDRRKTVQFVERKFLDEQGNPIDYLGDAVLDKYKFWGRPRNLVPEEEEEEDEDESDKKGEEKKGKKKKRKNGEGKKNKEKGENLMELDH